jgi:hypothetical protein
MAADNGNGNHGNGNGANGNGNGSARENATAALFQKAHQKIVLIQRLDEQLTGLLEQRNKMQNELRGVQALLNDEFDRLTRTIGDAPAAAGRIAAAAIDG